MDRQQRGPCLRVSWRSFLARETGLRFETMEHGGEYPDTMPQAIKLMDAEDRSCIYVPITEWQGGRQPRVYARS
jgi:hypothetical protein